MNNLNGSEKQIAWATDIRREFIEKTKADMKSADKNDVLDMKAMLKVADNITEAADWINARRNVKIMFFDRADFSGGQKGDQGRGEAGGKGGFRQETEHPRNAQGKDRRKER